MGENAARKCCKNWLTGNEVFTLYEAKNYITDLVKILPQTIA